MRYTYEQYERILADANYTAAVCKIIGKPEPFKCITTSCAFCPFAHGEHMCWTQRRTADEWQSWLEEFMACNDPGRPYTVEIPANAVDDIDTALNLGCVDTATAKLLESIQKQINDQNRN